MLTGSVEVGARTASVVSPMTDLASWLLAQIADDEAAARAASKAPWKAIAPGSPRPDDSMSVFHDASWNVMHADPFRDSNSWFGLAGPISKGDAQHIARHDPTRVLAECAAKRAIVELHAVTVKKLETEPFDAYTGEPNEPEYEVDCAVCGWASDVPTSACQTLRLLAQPYADRPGWDPAWKVET